ncbi:TPA: helix-turn-helix domain-containing protein [Photobacterium damselae]
MESNHQENKFHLHYGWSELFKNALIRNGINNITIGKESDINLLRSIHFSSIKKLDNDLFSIDVSESISPFTFDCYSMLLYTSSSIDELIYNMVEYFTYISPIVRLKRIETNKHIEIFIFNYNLNTLDRITHIGLLTIISVLLSMITNSTNSKLNKIYCCIPIDNYSSEVINEIERRFNVTVLDSSHFFLRIQKDNLKVKPKLANELLYCSTLKSVKNKVYKLKDDNIIHKIYIILEECQSLESITTNYIANKLFISARTLSRKLNNLDTSFKYIITNYRIELALHLLKETNVSLQEITYRLGFSEQSTFNHAFKRWIGQTPLEVRKNKNNEV